MWDRLTTKLGRRWNRYRDLELRVNAVETAIICLTESPTYVHRDDVGLNGQLIRKKMVADLVGAVPFDVVVETGTWIGDTTGYFATAMRIPVYSCELHKVPHTIAKLRLAKLPRVHLALGDSRAFLRGLTAILPPTHKCLFYLDAHWHSDLPLAEELDTISSAWREYVIVVDDFRVPGDDGYYYDSYGSGKSLSLEDFRAVFERCGLHAFFPATPSTDESGYKRGCVVLAPEGGVADKVRQIHGLRQHR